MLIEPLTAVDAKKVAVAIVAGGTVVFSDHAQKRMVKRKVTAAECLHAIRAGRCGEGEWKDGTWRYPFTAGRLMVVVAFDSETEAVIVTVVRKD